MGYRKLLNARQPTSRGAFTLVELLVCLGIAVLIIAAIAKVLGPVRNLARDIACSNNMRQIDAALISYASQNHGFFPPNTAELGEFWYLERILGLHLTAPDSVARAGAVPDGADRSAGLAGGVFRCPNDLDDSVRSYSMNVFASGAVSHAVQDKLASAHPPGKLLRLGSGGSSSRLLLLLESWPELPIHGTKPTQYAAQAVIGLVGKPGERFGGGGGVMWTTPKDGTLGRFDVRASQVTFYRHRRQSRTIVDPRGRANFAFCDGHVEMLAQEQLVGNTGQSTRLALWSALDEEIERE
jgi:prepilin-type processing-associated H-X9-DG protein